LSDIDGRPVTSPTGIKGIDHAAILVADLAKAEATYRRLGFKTTPIGRHNKVGTANHCIMFDEDFFEILTIVTPTPFNKPWAEAIAEREGLWALAFDSDDVRATHAGLKAAGFSPTDPADFSRPVDLDGQVFQARFTLTYLEPTAVEGIRLFVCQHHTPDLVWRPEYQGHPNAATSLAHVTLAVDDPLAAAAAYGRITGTTPVPRPGGMDIPGGRTMIRLLSAAQVALEFAGDPVLHYRRPVPVALGFAVADRRTTRAVLRAAGIAFRELDTGGVRVASADANGVALDFE
jgi:catechol 2,3-dioxygenase-like lactoylglutathione lyase family enzyme